MGFKLMSEDEKKEKWSIMLLKFGDGGQSLQLDNLIGMLDLLLKDCGSSGMEMAHEFTNGKLDPDSSGEIEFPEFKEALKFMCGFQNNATLEAKYPDLRSLFDKYDRNKSGAINIRTEFWQFMSGEAGFRNRDKFAVKLLKDEFDKDCSGKIEFNEFSAVLDKVTKKANKFYEAKEAAEQEAQKKREDAEYEFMHKLRGHFQGNYVHVQDMYQRLDNLLKDWGTASSDLAWEFLKAKMDPDHSGTIDFPEFKQAVLLINPGLTVEKLQAEFPDMEKLFTNFDINKSDGIDDDKEIWNMLCTVSEREITNKFEFAQNFFTFTVQMDGDPSGDFANFSSGYEPEDLGELLLKLMYRISPDWLVNKAAAHEAAKIAKAERESEEVIGLGGFF